MRETNIKLLDLKTKLTLSIICEDAKIVEVHYNSILNRETSITVDYITNNENVEQIVLKRMVVKAIREDKADTLIVNERECLFEVHC